MLKRYQRSNAALFALKVGREAKKMASELKEHRYYLERNVAMRTEELLRRINLLESCNASLCDKLALAQNEVAMLQQSTVRQVDQVHERVARLYIVNSQE